MNFHVSLSLLLKILDIGLLVGLHVSMHHGCFTKFCWRWVHFSVAMQDRWWYSTCMFVLSCMIAFPKRNMPSKFSYPFFSKKLLIPAMIWGLMHKPVTRLFQGLPEKWFDILISFFQHGQNSRTLWPIFLCWKGSYFSWIWKWGKIIGCEIWDAP